MPAAKGVLSTCVMSDIQSKGFCNLIPMAIFKGPSEGFAAAGVWSRKRSLAALGGGLVVSSHCRGHCWKNPIYSWFRGPFDITVIRGSTISFQLLTLESYWIISVPYLCGQSTIYISVYICVYLQRMDFNRLNSKWACHRIKDAPQARIVTGKYTTNWNLSVI